MANTKVTYAMIDGAPASARDKGALGNGSHDDTSAINAALSSGASVVVLPAGRYKVTGTITIPPNVSLIGEGSGTTIIDASTADNTAFTGGNIVTTTESSLTALPSLASNIVENTKTIVFSSAPSVAKNDVLIIYNPTDYSWSGFRSYYRAGEFVRVSSVSGNTVTVVGTLCADYAIADVTIYKIATPSTCTIKGFSVIGNPVATAAVWGLRPIHCVDSIVEDIKVNDVTYTGIGPSQCYNLRISNCTANDNMVNDYGGDYGLAISNSHIVQVSNSWFTAARHGVTTGGGSDVGDVSCRFITIENSYISTDGSVQAMHFHGNIQYSLVTGCEIDGGCTPAGSDSVFSNNIIRGRNTNGQTAFYCAEWQNTNHSIINNTVVWDQYAVGGRAWFVDVGSNGSCIDSSTKRGGTIFISGNQVLLRSNSLDHDISNPNAINISQRGYVGSEEINVSVLGNSISYIHENYEEQYAIQYASSTAVQIRYYSGDIYDTVTIIGNKFIGGVKVYRSDYTGNTSNEVVVRSNNMIGSGGAFIGGVKNAVTYSDNTIVNAAYYDGIGGHSGSNARSVHVCNNHYHMGGWNKTSSSATNATLRVNYADSVICQGNFTTGIPKALSFTATTSTSFAIGETVTGGTSGATAIISGLYSTYLLVKESISGTFVAGETVTGATSGATGVLAATPSVSSRSYSMSFLNITNLWRGNQADEEGLGHYTSAITNNYTL